MKASDHLQVIKFWPSCAPGKGSAAGRKFCLRLTTASADSFRLGGGAAAGRIFLLRLTTASAQCLRLSDRFIHLFIYLNQAGRPIKHIKTAETHNNKTRQKDKTTI